MRQLERGYQTSGGRAATTRSVRRAFRARGAPLSQQAGDPAGGRRCCRRGAAKAPSHCIAQRDHRGRRGAQHESGSCGDRPPIWRCLGPLQLFQRLIRNAGNNPLALSFSDAVDSVHVQRGQSECDCGDLREFPSSRSGRSGCSGHARFAVSDQGWRPWWRGLPRAQVRAGSAAPRCALALCATRPISMHPATLQVSRA